jgi:hypothetical protein
MGCHITELSIVVAAVTIYGEVVACCSIPEQQPHRLPQSKGQRAKAKLLFNTRLEKFDYSLPVNAFLNNNVFAVPFGYDSAGGPAVND